MEEIALAIVFGCGTICATLIALFRGIWPEIPAEPGEKKDEEQTAKKKGGKA